MLENFKLILPIFFIQMNFNHSQKLYNKACEHLVGGVNSPVRAFASVGGNPIFIDKARGSIIKDVDGNRYIDYVLSYGPMILGHRHPKVRTAVSRALQKGYSFGASTNTEIKLAKLICDAFPTMDKIRFVNSGTEAVLSAIRLARGFTQKNKIIKFSGCYHGHTDALLVAAGSGLATLSMPSSKGVPEESVSNTLIANYNDITSVATHFKTHPKEIAAVIIEPVAGNMGVVTPQEKFLEKLQTLCKTHHTLLICDEVMTGFRSHFGGVQELPGIQADITCLGKVIGGGFPVGAYGARKEIMDYVAPLGDVYQAGTLSGNPIAMAAGYATLSTLKKINPYKKFETITAEFTKALKESAKKYKVKLQVNASGSMFNPFFTAVPVTDFTTAQTSDKNSFAVFFWEMIKNGVFLPPSQFESWFLSSSLEEKHLEKTIEAMDKSLKKVSEGKVTGWKKWFKIK